MAFDLPLQKQLIQLKEHLGGDEQLRRETPQDSRGHGAVEGCRGALAADVADDDSRRPVGLENELVKVAAQLAGGAEVDTDFETLNHRKGRRHNELLNLLRPRQVPMEPFFLLRYAFVEPRVFDGYSHGRSQQGEEMLNLLAEIALGNRLQVHHADGLPFRN